MKGGRVGREKVRDDTIVNAQRRDIIGYVTKE